MKKEKEKNIERNLVTKKVPSGSQPFDVRSWSCLPMT